MICEGKNGTNGCHLAVFSVDIAFSHHFVAIYPPPPSHPIGVPAVKSYLKGQAIQVGVDAIVDAIVDEYNR